jgi:hypothetical protein
MSCYCSEYTRNSHLATLQIVDNILSLVTALKARDSIVEYQNLSRRLDARLRHDAHLVSAPGSPLRCLLHANSVADFSTNEGKLAWKEKIQECLWDMKRALNRSL